MLAAEPSSRSPSRAPLPRAGQDLLRLAAALSAAGARVRARHDAEAVHDLRVAARRLEAGLRVWAEAAGQSSPPAARAARSARRAARRLRRAAAPVRELDVHVQLFEEWLVPAYARRRRSLGPVLTSLRAERDRAREELAARAGARLLGRIAGRVAECAIAIHDSPEALAHAVRRADRARHRAASALLAALGTEDDATLHAARIALKKWRYAAEPLEAVCPPEIAPLGELRAAQRVLGSIHDRATLRDLLLRLARRSRRAGDPRRSSLLAELGAFVEQARLALLKGLARPLRALSGPPRR